MSELTRRRTLVGVLGLAPVAALAGESFSEKDPEPSENGRDVQIVQQAWKNERAAFALRQLAAEIEAGRAEVEQVSCHQELHPDKIANINDIHFRVLHYPDAT